MAKYYYVTEYCEPYRQAMPVTYEKHDDGKYYKSGMACTYKTGCDLSKCKHYLAAPETVPSNILRDSILR